MVPPTHKRAVNCDLKWMTELGFNPVTYLMKIKVEPPESAKDKAQQAAGLQLASLKLFLCLPTANDIRVAKLSGVRL